MSLSRRRFLGKSAEFICLSSFLGLHQTLQASGQQVQEFEIFPVIYQPNPNLFSQQTPLVSVVKVNSKWSAAKGIDFATARALELIGGINEVTKGKESILLKPNLVNATADDTTNPLVIGALARMMKQAGKKVSIGEAGAASAQNLKSTIRGYICRTTDVNLLQGIQDDIFRGTGYDTLSRKIGVPLVNLHVGNMAKMEIPDNFVYKELYVHQALAAADLVCSVPMMKTHGLATVSLGLKNIGIGGYSGMMYGTVRSQVHQQGMKVEPTGTSSVSVDMVKANKLGLSVIDATMAMQGQGPSTRQGGRLVEMNLIIASTNALAADMVAARIMGFEPDEIDMFKWAWKSGMSPASLTDIEIVGEPLASVQQNFARPAVFPYGAIADWYGPPCA